MIDEALVKPALLLAVDEPSAVEIIAKRRYNAKTYDLGGGIFKSVGVLGAVHYKENPADPQETWKEIDLTIRDDAVGPDKIADKTFYDLKIFTDRVGYSYASRRGGQVNVELVEIGGQPVDTNRFTVRYEGNQLFWDDVADGVNLKIQLRPLSAEIFKQLADENAPRSFRWLVTESPDSHASFRRASGGFDDKRRHLEMLTTTTPITMTSFFFDEEWTGRVAIKHDLSTRKKTWSDEAVYPVIIDAFTSENIAANADDGYEIAGYTGWYSNPPHGYGPANTLSAWIAGYWYFETYFMHGGIRFRTLGVPQGATITNAQLKLQVAALGGAPQTRIYADDVDDAALWANGNLPSGIAKTAAWAAWSATATGTDTIGVTAIVQEIISRPGWASGDIRFAALNQLTGPATDAWARVWDYAKAQANAAVLEVTYGVVGQPMNLRGTTVPHLRQWHPRVA